MFITSTLPVIQIVIMCSIGALLARQVSIRTRRVHAMSGFSLGYTACIGAGHTSWRGQTASRPARVLRVCTMPDFHKASLLSGPQQPYSMVASACQHSTEVCHDRQMLNRLQLDLLLLP